MSCIVLSQEISIPAPRKVIVNSEGEVWWRGEDLKGSMKLDWNFPRGEGLCKGGGFQNKNLPW